MTYSFHVYAMIGEADNGCDELKVGAGYFLGVVKDLKLRLGFEWDHYGQGDFFFENVNAGVKPVRSPGKNR